jgi:formyl-CoA transferase/CoA:oxalate CoA-transferase
MDCPAAPEKGIATADGWPVDPDEGTDGLPLSGVRVLDLSRIIAGPFATMILADLGADVIKVERAEVGDDPRRWGPPFHGTTAAYFTAVNRNRRSIEIDLMSPEGRRVVGMLARAADVVVENFLPVQAEKLGLTDVRAATHAVWVSLRGAGSDGPGRDQPGVDAMIQARCGLMSVTGHSATGPAKVGVPIVDIVSGLYAAVAALAGLIDRRGGRRGRRFEVPLLEAGISALLNQSANYLVGGVVPEPMGNDHPNIVPYGVLPTADGQIFLGATTELQFARLARMLDTPELAQMTAYSTNAARVANRTPLIETIAARTRQRSTAAWLDAAAEQDVLAAAVNDVAHALSDPHVTATGLVVDVATSEGPLRLVGSPILVDGQRLPVRRPPPALGEHTADVLADLPPGPEDSSSGRP